MRVSVQSKFSDDEDSEGSWTPPSISKASNSMVTERMDEDDIPLAQRIPGALQAQRSIRIRDKTLKGTRARSQSEAKQHGAPKFTEQLVSKLEKLKDVNTQSLPSMKHADYVHSPSPSTHPPPSVPSPLPNASRSSESRPRNKSFSHQSTPDLGIIRPNSKGLLTRSSTQSASRPSPKNILPYIDSPPVKPSIPPSQQVPTPSMRARSKSLSSSSKMSDYPLRSNDRPPPVPIPSQTHIMQGQLRTPVQPSSSATQHRIFIDSMQRFNTVGIQAHTCAHEIITKIASQGELGGNITNISKDWMLWEIAQDFGLERPIRHYERPSEIYASWNSNTRLNAFMLKRTPLSTILAPDKIPSSSPTCSGYVQWESKRGKWNKRWMELKEHSIWLSKRNTGKDRTFLCSISSFDCYFMSRQYKAPKSFVFALKSTDNLTMFENPADYLHVFSCDQNDGPRWTQAILLARSYVLHKERTVLFTSPQSPTIPTTTYPHFNHREHKKPSNVDKPFLGFRERSGGTNDKELFQSGSLLARS